MKRELTIIDKVLEFAIWLVLALLWIYTIWNYSILPETIPSHFNLSGQVDDYSKKETIFILPVVLTILIAGMKILGKFPGLSSYGKNIAPGDYSERLALGTKISRIIILGITILFFFITYEIIQNGMGNHIGLGIWFIPLMVVIIFLPSIYFIFKVNKINRK